MPFLQPPPICTREKDAPDIPVEDSPTEDLLLEHFPRSTEFITSALSAGGKVLVHCQAGVSRSPTVVATYLMEVYGLSPGQAAAKNPGI
jgi:dual specificity phosphatase 12